ncbi:sulfite dehydrogenase [Bradyrhizobium guangzhouense]|uniref:Sulfite dehydrogenase n=1 Tax=Bradyrhizobium guangzhouense TaxID=1325095 RepID=A0AAE5WWW5_9BRAD|nr:sulfite dehydrogenase [Bradyrhizobium guangzhouense]QAU44405.1 sulfite dehydrogenase [Bradyrhizobium guangzhouense]RXH09355.1 sulfite dehydrogenase [Bradyrhizobium guangzhouense]RXH10025.1 sulfite dehydrogenase [Bradyrhizobium guangzhouense]
MPEEFRDEVLSRRWFLTATAGAAGAAIASTASAETLADVPDRGPGADLSAHSERSRFAKLDRIPESTPGKRNIDPSDAINSKTPHQKLVGNITPTDLHYERSHSGVPDIDPSQHRLLIHGMVGRPLVFSVDDLKRMPSVTRIVFIECTGNGWENWKKADPDLTVQNTHGLVSTNEWTGVPLKFLVDLVAKDKGANWMLAEGGDGAGVDRSIPLTDEIMEEAFVAYGQNGEPLRPAHGFPMRLLMPGFEGNLNIKWLRRLKFGAAPWMTRWETARYTQLLADGKARQFQFRMETNSVITQPSGMMQIQPGYNRISGLAWSGHGKIAKVEISTDGAKTWKQAQLTLPLLSKAQVRFQMDWDWDGKPTKIVSRSTDEKGNVQPDRASFIAAMGTNALFHYNAQQTWSIDEAGRVRNVLA